MSDIFILSFIINGLLGIAMYFMKMAHDNTREQLKEQRQEIVHIKDTYFKKEDFREFKDELWNRFDKMEIAFERRLQQLDKK